MTQEFKDVIVSISKEEFRNFMFKKFQDIDPCISIATYELLGELINGQNYEDISDIIVNSYITYIFLKRTEQHIKNILEQKEKEGAQFEIWNSTENKNIRKIDLSNDKKRNFFIKISALYWYAVTCKHYGLPVSPQLDILLQKYKEIYNIRLKYPNEKTELWKMQVIRNLEDKTFDEFIDVRYAEFMKFTLSELLHRKDGWQERIKTSYIDLCRIANKNKSTDAFFICDDTASLTVDIVLTKFQENFNEKIFKVKEAITDEDKSYMIISMLHSYFYNVVSQATESYRKVDEKKLINDLFDVIEIIESEYSKKGVEFAVGLWGGVFFSGPEWLDKDSNPMDYPVYSFRLNDRLQYSFFANKDYKVFIYIGGIVDILTNHMFNKYNRNFFYIGTGFQYKDISTCISLAMTPTLTSKEPIASVFSVMYDIPFSKIWKILMKKK